MKYCENVRPWINYHHLYYFKVIATEGSIAKASEKLLLGQPALSAQLRQLESNLGVALFDRYPKKLVLTETGKVALAYANDIFKTGAEMFEALHDRLVPKRVHLQIGALDGIPKSFLLKMVQKAMGFGNVTVSVLEGKGDELMRELLAHRIDLFLSNYKPPSSDKKNFVSVRLLARSPVSIYGSKKFLALKKNFPRSLNQAPVVFPTWDSRLRHEVEDFYKLRALTPDIICETQDTSLQKMLGETGMGLVPLSQAGASSQVKEGGLVRLGRLSGLYEEYYLLTAVRKIENPVASRLMRE